MTITSDLFSHASPGKSPRQTHHATTLPRLSVGPLLSIPPAANVTLTKLSSPPRLPPPLSSTPKPSPKENGPPDPADPKDDATTSSKHANKPVYLPSPPLPHTAEATAPPDDPPPKRPPCRPPRSSKDTLSDSLPLSREATEPLPSVHRSAHHPSIPFGTDKSTLRLSCAALRRAVPSPPSPTH